MSEEIKGYQPGDAEKEKLQKDLEQQKIIRETVDELTNNPKYKETFDLYRADSVKEFIKNYANEKSSWLRYGEMYVKNEIERSVQFREDAMQYLCMVIQKKMFNKQCLWRAGETELEGVESIYDFWHWEKDFLRCPFLEPITREEWEVFKKGLASENIYDMGPLIKEDDFFSLVMFKMQGYDEFKKHYNENGGENPFPDWYNFYDLHLGTGKLFHLPDLRGPKELKYMLIGHDHQYPEQHVLDKHPEIFEELKEKLPQAEPPAPPQPPIAAAPIDKRSFHDSDDTAILNFMEEFEEDEELKEYGMFVVESREKRLSEEKDVSQLVEFLLKADEQIPVKASWDWREAIESAVNEYKYKKKMEVLDDVFEDYLMRVENKIPLDMNEQYLSYAKIAKEMTDLWKLKVLTGRKVLGEPEDFSFNK